MSSSAGVDATSTATIPSRTAAGGSTTDMSGGVDKDGSPFVHVVAGFISGAVSSIVTNPLDIVKTRIQTQDVDVSVVHKSRGVLDELRKMFKHEGSRAVFRGMYVILCAVSLSLSLQRES